MSHWPEGSHKPTLKHVLGKKVRLYKLALFSQHLTLELGMGPHISATGVGWADAIHGPWQ